MAVTMEDRRANTTSAQARVLILADKSEFGKRNNGRTGRARAVTSSSKLQTQTRGVNMKVGTYDLRRSPFFLNRSMMRTISLRPLFAFTFMPPRLMLIFSDELAISSRFRSSWRMCRHTKTPQSLLFSWTGESSRLMKRKRLFSRLESFSVACRASSPFPGGSES